MKSKAVFIAVAISLSLIIAGQVFYIYRQHLALQTKYSNFLSHVSLSPVRAFYLWTILAEVMVNMFAE